MPESGNCQSYVILVRHASREPRWDVSESKHAMKNWTRWTTAAIEGGSDFETKGFPRTYAIAGRLCDELENMKARVVALVHSKHKVAQQTAEVYGKVLEKRERFEGEVNGECSCDLTPEIPGEVACQNENAQMGGQTERIVRELEIWKARADSRGARSACVLVGHQPQLTQIARRLVGNKFSLGHSLPGDSLPIGNSEVACIEFGDKPRLLWVLTEKPKDLLAELKDKIKSKYDVAKFFLGAFAVNTGLLLNAGIWGQPELWEANPAARLLAYAAIVVALVSLIFTAFTLFSYDSLMMPESLWSEPGEVQPGPRRGSDGKPPTWSVSRPPSQAQVILYYEMMHVWTVFFMPAVVSAFVAIGCLVLALVCRDEGCLRSILVPPVPSWVIIDAAAVLVLVLLRFYWWKKPRLGTED